MDPTVVATEGYTSYNVGAILIAATIAALSLFLIFGAIIGYRKSNTSLERLFAIVAILGSAAIFVTLGFGTVVSLSATTLWLLLFAELGTLSMVFWVWMLVDCATKEQNTGNDKLIWVLIILFTHVLGATLYFLIRRPRRLMGVSFN